MEAKFSLSDFKNSLDTDFSKVLFYIYVPSTGTDYDLILYRAKLNEKKVVVGLDYEWRKSKNIVEKTAISETAKAMFFGTELTHTKSKSRYILKIKCFEDDDSKDIVLNVKGSGAVIPKIVFDGKEEVLQGIVVDFEFQSMAPRLTMFSVYTVYKNEKGEKKLAHHDLDLEELSSKFNVFDLLRMFAS